MPAMSVKFNAGFAMTVTDVLGDAAASSVAVPANCAAMLYTPAIAGVKVADARPFTSVVELSVVTELSGAVSLKVTVAPATRPAGAVTRLNVVLTVSGPPT